MPWRTLGNSIGLIDLLLRDFVALARLTRAHHDLSLLQSDHVRVLTDRWTMADFVGKIGGRELTDSPPDISNHPTFLHIAKTAGTSFHAALEQAYGVPALWMNLDSLRLMPPEVVSAVPLIVGHIPWEGRKLLGRDRRFVTILRDPRARTLSHYHQIAYAPEVVAEVGELTLDDFLFNPRWSGLCTNYQTRQLGLSIGLETCGREWEASSRFEELGEPFPRRHDFPLASLFDSVAVKDWQDLFDAAAAALQVVDTVLVTEKLDQADVLLASHYEVDIPTLSKLNSREYRQFADLPDRFQRRIISINEADMELWEMANHRFGLDLAAAS